MERTLERVRQRLSDGLLHRNAVRGLREAALGPADEGSGPRLRYLPVKEGDEIILVTVEDVSSIVADGELLNLTTRDNRSYSINYRLKDLESRLSDEEWIRLSRGALVNLSMIDRATQMPGGSYIVILSNGQELQASRAQSRLLRDRLLKL